MRRLLRALIGPRVLMAGAVLVRRALGGGSRVFIESDRFKSLLSPVVELLVARLAAALPRGQGRPAWLALCPAEDKLNNLV